MTSTTEATAMNWQNLAARLGSTVHDVWQQEMPRWVFAFKTLLSALIALWISFRLGFTAPSTSLITVFIIAQPQSGLVLAKSFYRVIGSGVGVTVGLLLVGTLVQQRELFVLCLALWMAICTAGAAYFRGFQSYAFVLAGYSALIVGIPSVNQPQLVFDTALFRLSEIMVGILVTGVVTDALFPRRIATVLVASVRTAYSGFAEFAEASFNSTLEREVIEENNLSLIQQIVGFEAQRSAAGFEDPELRARDSRLRLFNAELIAAQTSLSAFTRSLDRSRRQHGPMAAEAFQELTGACIDAVRIDGRFPAVAAQAMRPLERLERFRGTLDLALAEIRAGLATQVQAVNCGAMLGFDIAADLFVEFVEDLIGMTAAYVSLATPRARAPARVPAFALHTDGVGALFMGLRAALTVALLSVFWIETSWPSGAGATLIGGVVTALFAAAPNPGAAVRRFVAGFVLGLICGAVCGLVLLPRIDGFPMLGIVLAPFLMTCAYLITDLKTAALGTSLMLMFASSLSLSNQMRFDPVQLFNDGLGQIFGVVVAGVSFAVWIPARSGWADRRLKASLRRYAAEICVVPLAGLRQRMESRVRDALTQIAALGGTRREQHTLIAHQMAVLDIAHAVFRLRDAALQLRGPFPSARQRRPMLLGIRSCLLRPDPAHRAQALAGIRKLMLMVDLPPHIGPNPSALWRLWLSILHLESLLLDDRWFVDLAGPDPIVTTLAGSRRAAGGLADAS